MTSLVLRDVELGGLRTDVQVVDGVVARVGPLPPLPDTVIDGAGGALLPGLHDHHVHLAAMAAAHGSVDCSPASTRDLEALRERLRNASGTGWIRAVGYHETIAGPLDRDALDRLVPDRPLRVQHRSGALWMLNSRALDEVGWTLPHTQDVERGPDQRPNGRLWRYDDQLRVALGTQEIELSPVGSALDRYGITGVTDATPDLDASGISLLSEAVGRGDIRARVMALGVPDDWRPLESLVAGPRKILLRDHALPSYDELRTAISGAHAACRPVAVHCVTRDSLVLTLAALEDVGSVRGDRIEHAAVVPPESRALMKSLGVHVVTQPWFIHDRGDAYLAEVDDRDVEQLYPYASLVAGGIPTAASSDAPYGTLDPWSVIAAAIERRSRTGVTVGGGERVAAVEALHGYLTSADDPGGRARVVAPGVPADLVLLTVPLRDALADPSSELVAATFRSGEPRFPD